MSKDDKTPKIPKNPYAQGTAEYQLWNLKDSAECRARTYDKDADKHREDAARFDNMADQARREVREMETALIILDKDKAK